MVAHQFAALLKYYLFPHLSLALGHRPACDIKFTPTFCSEDESEQVFVDTNARFVGTSSIKAAETGWVRNVCLALIAACPA
jgi:hypothetical protein